MTLISQCDPVSRSLFQGHCFIDHIRCKLGLMLVNQ